MTRDKITELIRSRSSIFDEHQKLYEDMLETCFKVQLYGTNKFGPLKVTEGQRRLLEIYLRQRNAGKPIRIIILKARQLGISSLIAAILTFEMFMREDLRCAVAAHVKERTAEHLYDYYLNYLRFMPEELHHLRKRKNSKGGHTLIKTNSFLAVEHEVEIRGRAMDMLHLSEAAYYKDLPKFMAAVDATLAIAPETAIFMESTARRYDDDFHRRYKRAVEGDDAFEALFLAWYLHEDYVKPFESDDDKLRFRDTVVEGYHDRWGNEESLLKNPRITLEHLHWRRDKLRTITLIDFYKEYPSTPEEAFMHTDANVFDPVITSWYMLNDRQEPELEGEMDIAKPRFHERSPMFVDTRPGIIKVIETPDPNCDYTLGIDTSRGKRDYCSLQILKRRPLEQVATLRGYENRNLIPSEFAEQVLMLWKWYNYGHLGIENNDAGITVIDNLLNWGCHGILTHDAMFPNFGTNKDYGWQNNVKTNQDVVEKLRYAIDNKTIRIHEKETIEELQQFIYHETEGTGISEGRVKAMAARKGQIRKPGDSELGYYDDRVISLGGAYLAHLALPPPMGEREKRIEQDQTDHADLYDVLGVGGEDDNDDGIGMGYNPYDYMGIYDEE